MSLSQYDKHFNYLFIVDDDEIQTEMIKDYLNEQFSFKIKTYPTGEEMLNDLHLNPEIIILDYFLNGKNSQAANGMDILKVIKEKNPNSNVIMMSGQDNIDVAIDCLQHGAYDYVVKGESAFQHLTKTINRLGEIYELKLTNDSQKKAITYLSIAVILIILASFFYIKFLY